MHQSKVVNLKLSEEDLKSIVDSKKSFQELFESLTDEKTQINEFFQQKNQFFDKLIELNALCREDILYLFDKLKDGEFSTLRSFTENVQLLTYCIECIDESDFKKFVDLYLFHREQEKGLCKFSYEMFFSLLEEGEWLQSFLASKSCTSENVQYLIDNISTYHELWRFDDCVYFLKQIVEKGYIKLDELVDKYCSFANKTLLEDEKNDTDEDHPLLWLIHKVDLWRSFLKLGEEVVTHQSLRHFLNKIENSKLLDKLCDDNNLFLAKYCFDNLIFDENILQKYTKLKRKNGVDQNLFFDYVQQNFNAARWSNPTKRYRKIYATFKQPTQRQEIYSIVQKSERAKNTLLQIVDNNLLDQYSFESLKTILTKDDTKKLKIKMNF